MKKYGTKITVTSFMLKAISLALYDNPKVNSKFGPADANPPSYTVYGSHNISVAVDTPGGLMVPNIKASQANGHRKFIRRSLHHILYRKYIEYIIYI